MKFVQVSLVSSRKRSMAEMRRQASQIVQGAAVALRSPKLSALAALMQTDVFSKVKEAVDAMVTQLKQEQKDELKHRDWCIDELNQNEKQTDDGYDAKKALETQQEDLALFLQNVDGEIAAANE